MIGSFIATVVLSGITAALIGLYLLARAAGLGPACARSRCDRRDQHPAGLDAGRLGGRVSAVPALHNPGSPGRADVPAIAAIAASAGGGVARAAVPGPPRSPRGGRMPRRRSSCRRVQASSRYHGEESEPQWPAQPW